MRYLLSSPVTAWTFDRAIMQSAGFETLARLCPPLSSEIQESTITLFQDLKLRHCSGHSENALDFLEQTEYLRLILATGVQEVAHRLFAEARSKLPSTCRISSSGVQ